MHHRGAQKALRRGAGSSFFGTLLNDVEAAFDLSIAPQMHKKHGETRIGADQTVALFGHISILQTDFQMLFRHRVSFFFQSSLQCFADIRGHLGSTQPDGVVHCLGDSFTLDHS